MRMGGDISEDDLTCVDSYMISLIDLASAPGRRRILAVYPCHIDPQAQMGPQFAGVINESMCTAVYSTGSNTHRCGEVH